MQTSEISILSTRPLDPSLIKQAEEKGIMVDWVSFIKVQPLLSAELSEEIEAASREKAYVIFTSSNALNIVAGRLGDRRPGWRIFCLGTRTKTTIEKLFGKSAIHGSSNSATGLAKLICSNDSVKKVIFFCGDQRRNELPELLTEAGIGLKEIVVYKTIERPRQVKKKYSGVLFFSPSAVNSFFKLNDSIDDTVFFAIGNTTATQIKKFTNNQVLVAETPGAEILMQKALNYFL